MTAVAGLLLATACWLWGHGILAWSGVPRVTSTSRGIVVDLLAGLVGLALLLSALQGVGIAWSREVLAVVFLLPAPAVAWAARRRATARTGPRRRDAEEPAPPGWGDGIALAALAGFGWTAVHLRATTPDFIYHWGIKAKKFFLAGGVDYSYLSHPWNHFIHPDYPNLLPELYAATARLAGRFGERGLMIWSVVFAILLVLAVRDLLRRLQVSPGARQAGTAAAALAIAAFAVRAEAAGGADLPLALVATAGLGLLAGRWRAGEELLAGWIAAAAIAVKMEGTPLALFLVVTACARAVREGQARWQRWVLALAPPAAVAIPWLVLDSRFHLFQPTNTGSFHPGRTLLVLRVAWESFTLPAWHLVPLVLLLLPVGLAVRRTRWVSALLGLQLGFYLFVYLTAPFSTASEVAFYIRSSFPRLLLHLVPGALGVAVALADSLERHAGGTSAAVLADAPELTEADRPGAGRATGRASV